MVELRKYEKRRNGPIISTLQNIYDMYENKNININKLGMQMARKGTIIPASTKTFGNIYNRSNVE